MGAGHRRAELGVFVSPLCSGLSWVTLRAFSLPAFCSASPVFCHPMKVSAALETSWFEFIRPVCCVLRLESI